MAFYIDDYQNPHISVRGTLDMLGTTSEFEVHYEDERLMGEEPAGEFDRISAERRAYESIYGSLWSLNKSQSWTWTGTLSFAHP